MTTPVLDLSDADGQRRAEAARWAFRCIADRTTALLQDLLREPPPAASAGAAAAVRPAPLPPWMPELVQAFSMSCCSWVHLHLSLFN
jgi:hypothetical protein